MSLAPIALFCYNRAEHLKKTIESLSNNKLAQNSELFIFSDGWKNTNDQEKVQSVRSYLKALSRNHNFKNITIEEQKNNIGLSASIIYGVTKIVNKYGKIIVLEDDMISSQYFLTYCNESLDCYKDKKDVYINTWLYIPHQFK